jgi:hypothetical protein
MAVSLEIPQPIAVGLQTGAYERVGGVISAADTRQPMLWLREIGAPALTVLGSAASVLSLSLTAATFAVLVAWVDQTVGRLDQVQRLLDRLGRPNKVSCDAQIPDAFATVGAALVLEDREERHRSTLLALEPFRGVQDHLVLLVNGQLYEDSQVADEFLLLLQLAHLAEVRALLELEELDRAEECLRAGVAIVQPRVMKHFTQTLLRSPAAYLHPALRDWISLERLTRLHRTFNPAITTAYVFELLRPYIYFFDPRNDAWIDALPANVWDPALFPRADDRPHAVPPLDQPVLVADQLQVMARAWQEPSDDASDAALERRCRALVSLVQVVNDMETVIETSQRFAGYQDEIRGLRAAGLTFAQWCELVPVAAPSEAEVVYLQRAAASALPA